MDSKTKKKTPKQQRKAVLSILLVVAILITTAFAFLSATDSKTNVFTVGSVSILLRENFDKNLNGTIDADNDENGTGAESRIVVNADQPIVPGQKVIKTPYIINNGKNPAYVYLSVGIPVSGIDPFYKNENGVVAISGTDVEIPITAYAIQEGYKDKTGYSDIGDVYFSNLSNLFGDEYTGTDVKVELFNYLNNTDFANSSSENSSSINTANWAQIGSVYKTENYNYYVFAYKTILPVGESTEDTALFKGVQLSSRIGEEQPAIVNYFVQEEISGNTAGATANLATSNDVPENYILAGSTYSAIGEKLTLNTDYFVAKTGYTQKFYYEGMDTVAYTGDVITQSVTNLYGQQELIAKESVDENNVVKEAKYLEYVLGFDANSGNPYAIVIGADSSHSDYPVNPTEVVVPANVYATRNADGSASLSNGVFKGYLTGETVNIDYENGEDFENNVKPNLEAFIANTDVGALYEATELFQITNDYDKSELKEKDKLPEGCTVEIPVKRLSSAMQNIAECLMDDDDNMMTDPLLAEYANLIKVVQNYVLPDTIQNLYCTVPFWLEDDETIGIERISIPSCCTSLSAYVLAGQTKLEDVIFNTTLTTIEEGAFSDCVSLLRGAVKDSDENKDLPPVFEIPKSVSVIEEYAFNSCESLISVVLPDEIQSIGNGTFGRCSALENLNIPDSVTFIGYAAFSECSSLTDINIPNSVTSIDGLAFGSCTALTSITLPNSLTNISDRLFRHCSQLSSVSIPNTVTSIGQDAFYECSGLTSVNIPDSVTSIDRGTFYGCSGLTSINIPDSVTSIGGSAFYGCTGLTSIEVDSKNTVYDSRENCNAIIETETNTLIQGCKNTIIPYGVTSIGEYAFYSCAGLISITIPDSVTSIGSSAFVNCNNLTSVTIPDSVTVIAGGAFENCEAISSVTYSGTTSQWGTMPGCDSVFPSGTTIQCSDGYIRDGYIYFN